MIAALIAALVAVPIDEPTGPSPEELFAAYWTNFNGMGTLEVQWRRERVPTADFLAAQQARIADLNARAEALDPGSQAHRALKGEADALVATLARRGAATRTHQAFATDRGRFLMKIAPAGWEDIRGDAGWLLPEEPANAATYRDFVGFTLISYQGDPVRGFRICTPTAGGALTSAMVRQTNYASGQNDFPPLGTTDARWGEGLRHPIDAFFAEGPGGFRTVGRAAIDGREAVLIERVKETADRRSFLTDEQAGTLGDRVRRREIVRAYLDPARGGLPLKIEWDVEFLVDGRPAPRPKTARPYQELVVSEILAPEGGGSYPSRGAVRLYTDDPKWSGPRNTVDALVAGKVYDVPAVLQEETTWHAAKVRANAPLAAGFATLPFPDGTAYLSEVTGRSEVVGREARDGSWLPWSLTAAVAVGWVLYGLFAAARGARRRARAATAA